MYVARALDTARSIVRARKARSLQISFVDIINKVREEFFSKFLKVFQKMGIN